MSSPHDLVSDLAQARWDEQDPGKGNALPGSGRQANSSFALKIGATAETGTLPDPERPGLVLTVTCYSIGAGNRTYTAASLINVAGNTHFQFTAVNQVIILQAIPYAGNTNKCRWSVVDNDGTTLS